MSQAPSAQFDMPGFQGLGLLAFLGLALSGSRLFEVRMKGVSVFVARVVRFSLQGLLCDAFRGCLFLAECTLPVPENRSAPIAPGMTCSRSSIR